MESLGAKPCPVIITVSNGCTIPGIAMVGVLLAARAAAGFPAWKNVMAGTKAATKSAAIIASPGQRKNLFDMLFPHQIERCVTDDLRNVYCTTNAALTPRPEMKSIA